MSALRPDHRITPSILIGLAGAIVALALGLVVGSSGPTTAAALVAGLILAALVGSRPINGLLLGATVMMLVPYWYGRGGITVAQMAAALALVGTVSAVLVNRRRIRFAFVDWAVIGIVLAAIADWYLRGENFAGARATANVVTPLVFYFAARILTGSGRSVRMILWLLVLAGALASLTVFYEFAKGTPVFQNPATYKWNSGSGSIFRPGGIYGSPPAAVMVLAIVALVGIPLLRETSGRKRLVLLGCLALILGAAFATFTRAGWIGCGVGFVTYLVMITWRGQLRLPRWVAVVPLVGLVLLAALPVVSHSSWFQEGVTRGQTLQFRESYWAVTEPLITDSPTHLLFGRGLNSFTAAVEPALGSVQGKLAEIPGPLTQTTHNQYLQTLVEQGVVGLVLYLCWLLGTVVAGFRSIRRVAPDDRRIIAGLVGATVCFLVASFADSSFREAGPFVVIALITGLAVSLCAPAGRTT
jgi:O-antigen ligase